MGGDADGLVVEGAGEGKGEIGGGAVDVERWGGEGVVAGAGVGAEVWVAEGDADLAVLAVIDLVGGVVGEGVVLGV